MRDSLKKTSDLLIYHERPEQIAHSYSFVMSDLSDSRSQSLICPERSEQIAHPCSFDLSDLTNELMSDEQIPNSGSS